MRIMLAPLLLAGMLASAAAQKIEYKLLATNKTSTMQKEMQAAAAEGFHFGGVMGGKTAFGGEEVVVIMEKKPGEDAGRFTYKLLATNKTSTMQKEMQQMGDEGFEYKGQTVFATTFGGQEVVVILELDRQRKMERFEYKLLATNKTSTLQKELSQAGVEGFAFVGVTVANTAFGGSEVVAILRRQR